MRHLRAVATTLVALVAVAGWAWGSDLSAAIQKTNHLIILNELAVTSDQLRDLAPLSEDLVQATQARDAERQRLLTSADFTLMAARKTLVAGTALTSTQQGALDELEAELAAANEKFEEAAVATMATIEKEFLPQQNRYIDWTPPRQPTGAAKTAAQRAQRDREQTALILATVQQLERIRTYPLERYVFEAQKVVDDFLRPLIDPRSPDYPAAQQFMFKLVEQVRVMPENEWYVRREEMAATLVGELGLLGEPEAAEAPRPYNWQTMYAIFSDPGTPDLLRLMIRARATTAPAATAPEE